MTNVYQYIVRDQSGNEVSMEQYKGKTLLIVNTASKCGFTPQYKGLQSLYEKYKDQGLVVLGFPCNQFGGQEPEDDTSIKSFCELNFGVNFPLFSKVDVNGDQAHPLFKYLKSELPGLAGTKSIKWNFTKFLIDKSGRPIKRFAPQETPENLEKEISHHL